MFLFIFIGISYDKKIHIFNLFHVKVFWQMSNLWIFFYVWKNLLVHSMKNIVNEINEK